MSSAPEVHRLRIEIGQRQPFLAIANILIGVLFVGAAFDLLPIWQSAAWASAILVVQMLRYWLFRPRACQSMPDADFWFRAWLVSGLSGVVWGSTSLLVPIQSPMLLTVVQAFFIAGMASAAAVALSASLAAYLSFIVPAVLPFIILHWLSGQPVDRFLAATALCFLAGMSYVGWNLHRILLQSIRLAHANQGLMGELAKARNALEVRVARRETEIDSLLGIIPAFVWIAHDRDAASVSVSRYARQRLSPNGALADDGDCEQAIDGPGAQAIGCAIRGEPVENMEVNCHLSGGEAVDLIINAMPLHHPRHGITGAVAVGIDITQRKAAERGLALSEARFRDFAHSASDWLWETDAQHRFVWLSPNFLERIGEQVDRLYGRTRLEIMAPGYQTADLAQHRQCLAERRPFRDFEFPRHVGGKPHWMRVSGVPIFDAANNFLGYRGVGSDVTERRRAQDLAEHLATHDALTGLTNRRGFQRALDDVCNPNSADQAVLLIDVDRFKYVNDTYGHLTGDAFLGALARRIEVTVGHSGMVSRIGGDEFAVLLAGMRERRDLEGLAAELINAMERPLQAERHLIFPSISIGGAQRTGDMGSAMLMQHADRALFRAKHDGRSRYCLYDERLDQQLEENSRFTRQLAQALKRGEFELYYQPQVDLRTGGVTGAEALLRWHHPEHGLLAPVRFIELAESGGLMTGIGQWVIEDACRQTAAWRDAGAGLSVSVNLAQSQITDQHTVQRIITMLDACRLTAADLEFEITETVVMQSIAAGSMDSLRGFSENSLRLALDDFGTGYSSLAYLMQLPAQCIKIDRSFVSRIGESRNSNAIVTAIVGLGHTLGKTVLAEGVETAAQQDFLRELGCDLAQGYLYSRPIPSREIDPTMVYAA